MFAKLVHKFLKFTKSFVTLYISMQALPQAQGSLSSFQLNEELHCPLHIQQFPAVLTQNKKRLHYTPYNTLTIHSKHTKCHKSLNS